jgi:hypothetical protein
MIGGYEGLGIGHSLERGGSIYVASLHIRCGIFQVASQIKITAEQNNQTENVSLISDFHCDPITAKRCPLRACLLLKRAAHIGTPNIKSHPKEFVPKSENMDLTAVHATPPMNPIHTPLPGSKWSHS